MKQICKLCDYCGESRVQWGFTIHFSGLLTLLNHVHQEDLNSYWEHNLQFANGSPFSHPAVKVEDLARAWGLFMVDLFQKDAVNIDERLVFVNTKQYRGIIRHKKI